MPFAADQRPESFEFGLIAEKATGVTWSPDGDKLAFSVVSSGDWAIYVARADGAYANRLTPENRADQIMPAWSPDGERIAFVSEQADNYDIYTIRLDGTDLDRLTTNAARDSDPAWSPDGKRVIFAREGAEGLFQIREIEVDGSQERAVTTNDQAFDSFPAYRSDGSIVFSRNDLSRSAVRSQTIVVAPDGSRDLLLEDIAAYSAHWSPDRKRIVFIAGRSTNTALYVVDTDGGGLQKIVN